MNRLSETKKKDLLKHLVGVKELWIEAESEINIRHHENHNDLVRRIASVLNIPEREYTDQLKNETKEETIEHERQIILK